MMQFDTITKRLWRMVTMAEFDQKILKRLARKYIWWKTEDEAVAVPQRLVAQVMNIGDYNDVQTLANHVGEDYLRDVLTHAEIGQFSPRSWAYWHYRLRLSKPGRVPPVPARRFA
jgi:adenosine deaminase